MHTYIHTYIHTHIHTYTHNICPYSGAKSAGLVVLPERKKKRSIQDNSNEQIAELMAQEKDAIASEDFVAAQNLKTEINALQSKALAA